MPLAKDLIKKNVKEVYINPSDYIRLVPKIESEKEAPCSDCRREACYYCNEKY